jgi:hypothetical protein
LESGDAEAADKLAYNIIITALTLGQENIPAAIAAYDREKVILTTPELPSVQLILRSLQVVKEMSTRLNPVKYLNPPDIMKLRANINRLNQSGSQPARTLAGLLQLEYKSLSTHVKQNPCTQALSDVMSKLSGSSSILILSSRNHDAEALAFNSFIQSQKGNAVINID